MERSSALAESVATRSSAAISSCTWSSGSAAIRANAKVAVGVDDWLLGDTGTWIDSIWVSPHDTRRPIMAAIAFLPSQRDCVRRGRRSRSEHGDSGALTEQDDDDHGICVVSSPLASRSDSGSSAKPAQSEGHSVPIVSTDVSRFQSARALGSKPPKLSSTSFRSIGRVALGALAPAPMARSRRAVGEPPAIKGGSLPLEPHPPP
mmetsp:Transcript_61963/g.159827  ORF Transcript_61963/g.159827 Transcript_61963/m.159827 type:complete len:205 (-) Transcript_61963:3-617(-)